MEEYSVKVYIYDISKGMARAMSQALLGKQLDGIWHTGIVAYGQEFFFGGMGIESCAPGGTVLGPPDTVSDLGKTQIPLEMFMDYLKDQSTTSYRPECYHLLDHNCNTFSAEVSQFLTGQTIPSYITNLPQEVLNTPFGAMIRPFIDSMSVQPQGGHRVFYEEQTPAPPTQPNPKAATSQSAQSNPPASQNEASDFSSSTPAVFTDSKVLGNYAQFKAAVKDILTSDEQKILDEVNEYVSVNDCSWSLGRSHVVLIGNLLHNTDIPHKQKVTMLGFLRLALLKEDIQMLLSCDADNKIVKYLNAFENLDIEVQPETVKMCVNCCSLEPGLDWSSRTSEWSSDGQQLCNSRVMGRVSAAAILHDSVDVYTAGVALAFNFTRKKVDEENAVEIGSAVLQCVTKDLPNDTAYQCLIVLGRCMKASREVIDLTHVMGIDVASFGQRSPELQAVCTKIQQMLAV